METRGGKEGVEEERVLWPGHDAELKQARLRWVLLDGDGEAGGPCCLHGVRACRGRPHERSGQ